MAKKKLPGREDILERMWKLANARVEDAVRLACWPEEEPGRLEKLELDGLTEFKRGANGVIELKFTDRARLLELLWRGRSERAGIFPKTTAGANLVAARISGPGQASYSLRRGSTKRQDTVYWPVLFLLGHGVLSPEELCPVWQDHPVHRPQSAGGAAAYAG